MENKTQTARLNDKGEIIISSKEIMPNGRTTFQATNISALQRMMDRRLRSDIEILKEANKKLEERLQKIERTLRFHELKGEEYDE